MTYVGEICISDAAEDDFNHDLTETGIVDNYDDRNSPKNDDPPAAPSESHASVLT